MAQLAIFDLDGTLAASTGVDEECFVAAVRAELGFDVSTDWSSYRHCTDEGIVREAFAKLRGRPPRRHEVARLRDRFVGLLEERLLREPDRFAPVPGARRLLRHLERDGFRSCIATGGWARAAELKRRGARLPDDLTLFACDLDPARERIVEAAIAAHGGRRAFDRIVTVGDGVWDVRAAAALRLPFVGVGVGERAAALRAAGCRVVVEDFEDVAAAIEALGTAPLPDP